MIDGAAAAPGGGPTTLSLVFAIAVVVAFGAPAIAADVKPPADFAMPKAETSPGQVTFSHRTHVATGLRCTSCHMRDFKMKRGASGPVTLEAKQQGKFCGACHDGKTVVRGRPVFAIDECDRCHKD